MTESKVLPANITLQRTCISVYLIILVNMLDGWHWFLQPAVTLSQLVLIFKHQSDGHTQLHV